MQKIQIWLLGLWLLAIPACSGFLPPEDEDVSSAPPVEVNVASVESVASVGEYEAVGTVQSMTVAPISSRIPGEIVQVAVEEGDRVPQGRLLIKIDDREATSRVAQARAAKREAEEALQEVEQAIAAAEAQVRAAEAASELASSTQDRFEALFERKSVSRQEYDEVLSRRRRAEAQLEGARSMVDSARAKKKQVLAKIDQAEAGLESARLMLSYTEVRAPFSGIVTQKRAELGQFASPSAPLLTLEDPTRFEVEAEIGMGRLAVIGREVEVRVRIGALGEVLSGSVRRIVPKADRSSRTSTVKIDIPAVEGLKTGLFATIHFGESGEGLLSVPRDAVIMKGQLQGVYVVGAEDKARFRLIRTGRQYLGRVEILAGLEEGDRVVVAPGPEVSDGRSLRISRTAARSGLEDLFTPEEARGEASRGVRDARS